MFQVNDVVVYGAQGVCKIVAIDSKKIDGVTKQYFVLKPENNSGSTFYVPTWNEKALEKMRKVMSIEAINSLIDSMPKLAPTWISNEKERKETYTKILASGDQLAIIPMLQALFLHKKALLSQGKRMHISDENFIKDAASLLYNEWQYVLNVDKSELIAYICERIEGASR